MKRKNDQSWKPLAHLLSACGIPWIWYLADFIFSLLISMVTVRLPQMTGAIMQGEIFDKGLLADYVGITVFSMLLAFFSTVFGSWISLHTDRVLRKKIWEHFLYLPMTIYQTYKPSSLISRITQDTSGISYGISSCIGVLTNTWTIFLMLKNVYHMSPRMVAAMAVVIPWLILVSVVTGRFAFRASCRTQERFSDFTAVIAERLSNIRGIRIHGEELTELEKGREAARRQYESDLYQDRVNLFSQPFIYTSEAFLKALFLIYGGFLISRGELESGEFITIYMYLEMLPVFAIQYIFAYQTLKETQGASMRAGQLLLEPAEDLQKGDSLETLCQDIRFQDVSFRYGDRPVLSRATFTVPAGTTTAIVGPSGSGKTTVLQLLERFFVPDEGCILLGEKEIGDFRLRDWRSRFRMVSQNSPLLSGSLLSNLVYGSRQSPSEGQIEAAARQACSYGFICQLPKKFQSETGEMGKRFSAGERQRLALTRALAQDPEVLLLDEAVCHLDPVHASEVQDHIRDQRKCRSCVIVTHDMNAARQAGHIVVLDRGTVCGEGDHDTLYETCGTYRRLYDRQQAGNC